MHLYEHLFGLFVIFIVTPILAIIGLLYLPFLVVYAMAYNVGLERRDLTDPYHVE